MSTDQWVLLVYSISCSDYTEWICGISGDLAPVTEFDWKWADKLNHPTFFTNKSVCPDCQQIGSGCKLECCWSTMLDFLLISHEFKSKLECYRSMMLGFSLISRRFEYVPVGFTAAYNLGQVVESIDWLLLSNYLFHSVNKACRRWFSCLKSGLKQDVFHRAAALLIAHWHLSIACRFSTPLYHLNWNCRLCSLSLSIYIEEHPITAPMKSDTFSHI